MIADLFTDKVWTQEWKYIIFPLIKKLLLFLCQITAYIKHLEIRGMGGTDFRPAFSRVEALQKSREFTDLSGILVFTDGAGIYPDRKPDARCILVFLDRQYDPANLPRWAEILVLGGTATERNEY